MSKAAAILGLAAIASAAYAPPSYGGSSSAPSYGSSSSDPASYPSSSSAPSYPASSDPASYPSSSSPSSYPGSSSWSSDPSAYPSSSWSASSYPSSTSSTPAGPTGSDLPPCWTECFQEAGITSESSVCGNAQVATCIHDGCCQEETSAYWAWYNSYCPAPSSSTPVSPVTSSTPVTTSPATPTVECWGKCFAENDITSEEELCGNTAVDECIATTCDCADDKSYWAWYESFCTTSSSTTPGSPTTTTPVVPATSTSSCWGACFAEAGIASESELCGNTAVDQCIHDTCSPAEDKAYWQWYDSYCTPTGPVTTPCVTTTTTTSTPTPSSPVDSCWSECFAENHVTSEASLCGNDAVSKCIHDTCSAALDKAYWDWYDSFCVASSTSVITTSTCITTSGTSSTATYVVTSGYGWTPVTSSPATTLPTAPAPPPAPYTTWAPATSAAATGTGVAPATTSGWVVAPATGAGASNKPGVVIAALMALAAFF